MLNFKAYLRSMRGICRYFYGTFQTRFDNEKKKRKVCMQNVNKKFKIWGVLLLLLLFAVGFSTHLTAEKVQAATKTGFVTINGKSYYIDKMVQSIRDGWS